MIEQADGHRALRLELVIMLAVSYGLSALIAVLQLADAAMRGLGTQQIPLNPRRSHVDVIDFGLNAAWAIQLFAWGALGLYLLWRSGNGPADMGINPCPRLGDLFSAAGLAALIGIPGLALYLIARAWGLNAELIPAAVDDAWWHVPMLIVTAFANGFAEEVIVVGYLLTRLGQQGLSRPAALACSALLRGSYHLYQGLGAGLGNVVMGVVFGYAWQRTGRLWPLVLAHGLIDSVAFVGYSLFASKLGWLR